MLTHTCVVWMGGAVVDDRCMQRSIGSCCDACCCIGCSSLCGTRPQLSAGGIGSGADAAPPLLNPIMGPPLRKSIALLLPNGAMGALRNGCAPPLLPAIGMLSGG